MKTIKKVLSVFLLILLLCALPITGQAQWKNTKAGRRYYTSANVYVKSSWKKIGKKWYYFDKKGYMKTGRFKVNGKYYYVKKATGRVSKKKIGKYYYGSDGVMVTKKWVKIGKHHYYFGKNGKLKSGKIVIDGKTYFARASIGRVEHDWYKNHYYDSNGVMVTSKWVDGSYLNDKGDITKGVKNQVSNNDVRLLAALVYYEAGNQSYYGKKCVASIVVNRMKSKKFPNTLKEVLHQSGQFTPVMNGNVDRLYNSSKAIQKECINAAKYVLKNGSILKGYYYFNPFYGILKVGDHYFS